MLLFSFSASTTSNCDEVVITSFDSVLLEEELELLDVIEFFGVSLVEEVDVEENSSEKKIVVCMMRFTFAQCEKNKSICALFLPTLFFKVEGFFERDVKEKNSKKYDLLKINVFFESLAGLFYIGVHELSTAVHQMM